MKGSRSLNKNGFAPKANKQTSSSYQGPVAITVFQNLERENFDDANYFLSLFPIQDDVNKAILCFIRRDRIYVLMEHTELLRRKLLFCFTFVTALLQWL